MDEIATGHHAGFLPGMNGYVRRDVLVFQEFPPLADAVAGVPSQRDGWQGQPLEQIGNRFPLSLGGVSYSSGYDETTQVNDDVLLVMQAGRFTGPAGTPASVGIHRTLRRSSR